MRVALMIEGQEGVSWEQWLALARACEDAGLEGLFRSDHYINILGDRGGALDAWSTVTALAAVTARIHLGTLVSPATFRHPSLLARMVASASHVAGAGRIELGLGAGWNEAEHRQSGFPFPPVGERMSLFAEQLEIIRLSFEEDRFDFAGAHYELLGAHPLPKPAGRVNLIVGGSGRAGTIGPAVRFGDEYNTPLATPAEAERIRVALDLACEQAGREPLALSLMTRCVVGEDGAALARRQEALAALTRGSAFADPPGAIAGTVEQVVARLREYESVGVDRVMLQQLLIDDLEMVELLGREVAPQLR